MENKPLVSVLIPVYNYESYLKDSIESVLSQTYDNIEIIVQDNQSEDASFSVAMDYACRYPDRVRAARNAKNLGGGTQSIQRMMNYARGDYYFFFSADDVMKPDCVKRCIDSALRYPTAGLFLVERDEIDEYGNLRDSYTPFYDRSFFIDGKKHLPVFMMTGITILSQIMVSRKAYRASEGLYNMAYLIPTDWYLNFTVSAVSDMVYICEPLVNYRVHSGNETSFYTVNHIQTVHHYGMLLAFIGYAEEHGFESVLDRKDAAIRKLGQMCLRYGVSVARNGCFQSARNYLNLALCFDRSLWQDNLYLLLIEHLQPGSEDANALESALSRGNHLLKRVTSYEPPEGYVEIGCVDIHG